jgi:hypothetical protein
MDFDHGEKKYKNNYENERIHYLHVPSYKKNLSVKRLYSHICFALQLKQFLQNQKIKPDIIYCAMPTSTAAVVCGAYCRKNNIRFVIDVVDLWPDSLFPVNSFFKLFKWLFIPWKYLTINAYKNADFIIGESKKYVQIASKYNPSVPARTIYLGIDKEQIELLRGRSNIVIEKPDNEIWICYAGSLGNSYDFDVLLNAVKNLNNICNYKLLFIGDGERRIYLEDKIKELDLDGIITGFVTYSDYLKYLSYCDVGVNIFKKNTLVVHSYKFNDYVASNLFIVNSLKGETAELIDTYKIGLNFNFFDCLLEDILRDVCEKWDIYKKYKNNNIKLINEVLDKKIIYPQVLSEILNY